MSGSGSRSSSGGQLKRQTKLTFALNNQQSSSSSSSSSNANSNSSHPTGGDSKRRRIDQYTHSSSSPRRNCIVLTASNSVPSSPSASSLSASSRHTMSSTPASSLALARRRAHSPPPKKKMVIKPFKVAPAPPAQFESETMAKLSLAVSAVHQQRASDTSQEELYRAVESLCIHNKAATLYERLHQQCAEHVQRMMRRLADQVASSSSTSSSAAPMHIESSNAMTDDTAASTSFSIPPTTSSSSSSSFSLSILHSVQSAWSSHCEEMLTIRSIFLYLDRTYVIQQAQTIQAQQAAVGAGSTNVNNRPIAPASTTYSSSQSSASSSSSSTVGVTGPPKSLWEMGLGLFCRELKAHPDVESKVIHGILALIERERLGESLNRSLIKSLLRMFSALRLYTSSFQPTFLEATRNFYNQESTRHMGAEYSLSDYVSYVQRRLGEEEERVRACMEESVTHRPLMDVLDATLLRHHASGMIEKGFDELMNMHRPNDLAALYSLFARIHKQEMLKDAFAAWSKKKAEAIVKAGCSEEAQAPKTTAAAATAASAASSSSSAIPASPTLSAPAPAPAPAPASTPASMILDLLRLKSRLDSLLHSSFHSHPDFLTAQRNAFEHAINSVDHRPAELMAKFIDRIMRTGGKGIKLTWEAPAIAAAPTTNVTSASGTDGMDLGRPSAVVAPTATPAASSLSASLGDEEVEKLLDGVMFLFQYLRGKDIFQAWYKKDLAKRLLLHKSANVDAEKGMIAKMKAECGAGFTSKLEGMFKDMELSKDLQKEFEQHVATQLKAGAGGATSMDTSETGSATAATTAPSGFTAADLTVSVLTTGSWPAYAPLDVTLSSDVARAHEEFKLFYLNKHSGRKLQWYHSHATAILRGHFSKGRKELAVSGPQALVLLLFNQHTKLTMAEIGRLTGLVPATHAATAAAASSSSPPPAPSSSSGEVDGLMELKRTLASLTFTDDTRLLVKDPRNKKLNPTDTFRVNEAFVHKLFRIRVNTVQLKESREESKATTNKVVEDRGYALDAAIVRVMKARKTLPHALLIANVLEQIKFPAKPPDIKKRIASLIEREYMERDKDDSNVYVYIA